MADLSASCGAFQGEFNPAVVKSELVIIYIYMYLSYIQNLVQVHDNVSKQTNDAFTGRGVATSSRFQSNSRRIA